MKNILIIGCGLIGSSLLRSISEKKIAKKIFVYEKSKSNISKINIFFAIFLSAIDLNNDEPIKPHPIIKIFFIIN